MTTTAFDRWIAALEDRGSKIRRRGQGQAQAQCPAHTDRDPSLALTRAEGEVYVHCFAGCTKDDVLAALNFTRRDYYDSPRGAEYKYRNARGDVSRTVTKTPDKIFRQAPPGRMGPPILYRLPEVLAAVAAGRPVWLVEGEKDVHALEAVGEVATTAPQGAVNFAKVDASPLHGADVNVVIDKDDAGQKWAAQVRAKLDGKARSLTFFHAAVGKDAADHIAAHLPLKEFVTVTLPGSVTPDKPATSTVTGVTDVTAKSEGWRVLDDVEQFLARFVVYPGDHERVAHVLWIVHTWFMDVWESTPRIAFLSPEPGSGKSRALEVTEPLVPRPIHAVNATPAYLFRKVSDPAGAPTILFDEIDTIFGARAKEHEELRGLLNAGHRKGAMAGRCVIKGKTVETEELPAYCAVALAGLNDLPDTIMTRAVVVRMRRRAPGERVEPWRLRTCKPDADELRESLERWVADVEHLAGLTWPTMPAGVEDRNADVWEALVAVADLAGGAWPDRAREAAVALVGTAQDRVPSIGVMLLRDLRTAFTDKDTKELRPRLSTVEVLNKLTAMDESPWGDLRGKPLDARGLAKRLRGYGIKPKPLREGDDVFKGYEAADLADAWARYLPPEAPEGERSEGSVTQRLTDTPPRYKGEGVRLPSDSAVTSVTPVTAQVNSPQPVTAAEPVTVTLTCTVCRERLDPSQAHRGTHPTCDPTPDAAP